jgi:hypothetical protein
MHEARQSKRPVEAIKQEQEDGARTEQHEAGGVIRPRGKIST